jgi:murein DD-endopeptidase MepM/ murein hydrolase activator NlpD
MQKKLLLSAAITLIGISQILPGQGALAGSAPTAPSAKLEAAPAKPWVNPIKDEHLKPLPAGTKGAVHHAISAQEPSSVAGRGGLSGAETAPMTAPAVGGDASMQFLTRPYTTWHNINSVFDHCNPDYSTDGKVCRFDGSVGYKSYGTDPGFSLGYAQTPGGIDYLYYDGHNGWDYALNYEPVLAAADGVVRIAGTDSVNPCFGQTITVDHLNGYTTRYAHLSQIYVASGQSVTRGQLIAQSGNTGCSTGPHLHFGVYITSSWTAIDPWGWSGAPGADPWPSDPGNLWLTGYAQFPLPSAPTNVVAIPGVTMAYVSWTPPSFNGGTNITNYTVTVSPGGQQVLVPGSQTNALFGGLTNGQSYTFTVTAINSVASGASSATSNAVTPNAAASYYFAEGFAGNGFNEKLSILSPNQSGVAKIDYYTSSGQSSAVVNFSAGKVTEVNVNAAVGTNVPVSARVTLPVPGVVERTINFANTWRGSTTLVGASAPATEWDFAEGSTLSFFSEYLTLQNPNPTDVAVNLNYFTDSGAHPVKSLTLPANSRTTVEVFRGDRTSSVTNCIPGGPAGNCGVGPNVGGVSVQVKSTSAPIVAERPFYVNNFNFGAGVIDGGDVSFGANSAATQWYFAEGNTLPGFNEYLALQNPGGSPANVTLTYLDGSGTKTVKTLAVSPDSRFTVQVFDPTYGLPRNVVAASVQVSSDQPIVAERPMYIVHDFGSGTVAGATDVVGTNAPAKLFGFATGSTVSTSHEFLTLQNPGTSAANVSATYYTNNGPTSKTFVVAAGSRHTVDMTNTMEGPGAGYVPVGAVLSSDQPMVVEKVTYDSSASSYGTTDTLAATPSSF